MNLQSLDKPIESATAALLACQQRDGHWVFELEADATIPAEYMLLEHYLGCRPILRLQPTHRDLLCAASKAAWRLAAVSDGEFDISATCEVLLRTEDESVTAPKRRT